MTGSTRASGSEEVHGGGPAARRQLCSQVAETLGEVLAGQSGDDVLRNLYVVAVVPGPDVRRLLVTVAALPGAGEGVDPAQAIERLQHASARLRYAVAAAITRRRTLCSTTASPCRPVRRVTDVDRSLRRESG